mmetsp:Transcript_84015/g.153364  ORF Transcript_84015/g.153364 Transcript_84015/m.153364 type:complete len:257 (+) Transcript_84015:891-1661(+)
MRSACPACSCAVSSGRNRTQARSTAAPQHVPGPAVLELGGDPVAALAVCCCAGSSLAPSAEPALASRSLRRWNLERRAASQRSARSCEKTLARDTNWGSSCDSLVCSCNCSRLMSTIPSSHSMGSPSFFCRVGLSCTEMCGVRAAGSAGTSSSIPAVGCTLGCTGWAVALPTGPQSAASLCRRSASTLLRVRPSLASQVGRCNQADTADEILSGVLGLWHGSRSSSSATASTISAVTSWGAGPKQQRSSENPACQH